FRFQLIETAIDKIDSLINGVVLLLDGEGIILHHQGVYDIGREPGVISFHAYSQYTRPSPFGLRAHGARTTARHALGGTPLPLVLLTGGRVTQLLESEYTKTIVEQVAKPKGLLTIVETKAVIFNKANIQGKGLRGVFYLKGFYRKGCLSINILIADAADGGY